MTTVDIEATGQAVVPVVSVADPELAVPAALALARGGLHLVEITLRAPGSLEALRAVAQEADVTVGAGSVRSREAVESAVRNGARFIVSPGLSEAVVKSAIDAGIPVIPGAVTPSEVMAAVELGCTLLKFFPASSSGGPAAIASFNGPFPDVRFVPTGGITPVNARDYLAAPGVAAVGGSWLTPPALVAARQWDRIESMAAEAAELNAWRRAAGA